MHIERLYHHCFYVEHLAENDLFPIGGGLIGSADMPYKARVDFENFYPKFSAIAEKHKGHIQGDQWQQWFAQHIPDVAPDLLSTLQTFTSAFEAKRRLQSTNGFARNQLYNRAPDNTANLSEVFSSNQAMCVENSLLAKKFLDAHGVKSFLFSGEMMPVLDPGGMHFPEAHTFLIIEHNGQEYIYDPTNPNQLGGHDFAALMKPYHSLLSNPEAKKDCILIEAEDVLTHRKMYYGVGDHGNVPEDLILHSGSPKRTDPPSSAEKSDLVL